MMLSLVRNASIRLRLTAIIMAASAVAVLLTALTISFIGLYSLRSDMADELNLAASIVGDRNAAALIFNDAKSAENNLQIFKAKPSVQLACLYDDKGNVFAHYVTEAEDQAKCPQEMTKRTVFTSSRLEVTRPVIRMTGNDEDVVGTMYIRSDLRELSAYINKQVLIGGVVTLAALLVSYLLALAMQGSISKPVLNLTAKVHEIAVNKDYSVRVKLFDGQQTSDNNEFKLLTDAFNTMLYEIGEREARLKQQNVDLQEARDAAEAASRAKSQFLANVSHELRTPLNAVIGFSSILINQLFGPIGDVKYLEYSRDINEAGAHLLDIINDILDLSRAEAGNLDLHYEEVQVSKAVSKCIALLTARAEKGGVQILAELPRQAPPLLADRLRFMQIMLNVLSNAIKFTESGGKVQVVVETRQAGGDVAEFIITVNDTGIGMKPEDIEKAFQSFGQIDSGLNRRYEGTGLGLPLTRRLLALHHGAIRVESAPGKGTSVTIILPAVPPIPLQEMMDG